MWMINVRKAFFAQIEILASRTMVIGEASWFEIPAKIASVKKENHTCKERMSKIYEIKQNIFNLCIHTGRYGVFNSQSQHYISKWSSCFLIKKLLCTARLTFYIVSKFFHLMLMAVFKKACFAEIEIEAVEATEVGYITKAYFFARLTDVRVM